jgi:hypothetical protein
MRSWQKALLGTLAAIDLALFGLWVLLELEYVTP